MKVLIVLLAVFGVFMVASKITTGAWDFSFAGNMAMCVMLCFTALGHFLFTKGMVLMIPPAVPWKLQLVYLTGLLEVALGIALLFSSTRTYAGLILVVLFLVLLPANIYAANNHINIEKADHNGPGLRYLWVRIPMQLLFIGWVIYFSSC
jgi:uncharacterized membrane protein